ncbi:ATP-dependent metallopeptidase FtsH/Yme1/Tma family protein [Candidatus Bipolaricaulota bacterium]|nr:ATP-dependent metallopeptidase FtsH/Yme1/Tma family protein [Candidatus Bipolaricaulota bacterium]
MNRRTFPPPNLRTLTFMLVVIVLGLIMVQTFWPVGQRTTSEYAFSHFQELLAAGQVREVVIQGSHIEGYLKTGERFVTEGPPEGSPIYTDLKERMDSQGVTYSFRPVSGSSWFITLLVYLLPVALIIAFWAYMMRRMQGGGALSFGQSRAKLVTKEFTKVTFKDVAGIEEVIEEVREIVEYLRSPGRFTRLGAEIPKGVLLVGPPGTGKTLLARAIAGEAAVPFYSISGSDFVEMFVGVGAARVRDMFNKAKQNAPCIIFIDEIDAVGRKRGAGLGGGHDEREQTLNQLLAEMDGFESNTGVIVLAATNRPDVLDPALLRPGRFDRKIVVPRPDLNGREAILRIHTRNKRLGPDVDLSVLARRTPGFVGADLENLCNEAALLAARAHKEHIEMSDFEEALDRVLTGLKRRGIYITEREKERIAYHEAGHALVGKLLPHADPVHKISIIPRGEGALGFTLQLPTEDRYIVSREELFDKLTVLFGGRAAEEVVFGSKTTGAAEDFKQATEIAKRMVVEYGMSEALGPINLGAERTNVFLGEEIVKSDEHSEELSATVDKEIVKLLREAYHRAKDILLRNRAALDRLARELLRHEILEREEIDRVLRDVALQPAT